ncbi:carbohydrate-binding family 9-like protein [Paenibacillus glycanilyticus]|uniref:Carbohydrate-binding domain-containing protein n=1 Tax=Paenibacillus glycanilyticus TaxID=126569 RepID=A0ABQ6GHU5_9BACL|nr:carbohydrate-binding family 9-like protein [Paenibacillus glycanilyticus]GLX68632.1 hypothetical protein MU1_29770 [Paenibacillus glycanilyticus]
MTNKQFPYCESAADLSKEQWRQLPPATVAYQQWSAVAQPPETEVRGVYDDHALYLQFQVFEVAPVIRHRQDGAPVYEDSCVEFFFQPLPAEDARYFNFELNAAGMLLLEIGEPGKERNRIAVANAGQRFGIRSEVGLWEPVGGRMYWELYLRIPFTFVQEWFPTFRAIPGTVMRGNFYKCGDLTPEPHYLSWSPVQSDVPNFHRPDSFGMIMFGGRQTTVSRLLSR